MQTVIALAVGVLIGGLAGIIISNTINSRTIHRLRAKVNALKSGIEEPVKPGMETMKKFVWFCEINGVAWVWCSYILAALDKMQIAEDLSKVALVEIIAPVVVYAAKSAIENLSKHNRWPDKGPENEEKPQEGDGEEPPPSG